MLLCTTPIAVGVADQSTRRYLPTMLWRLRKPLLIAVLPCSAWLIPGPSPTGAPTASDPPFLAGNEPSCRTDTANPDSAVTCGKCHTEIYGEWKDRAHAQAWTDPIYQDALKDKKRPELCYPCHIPTSVLDRLGSKPSTRDDLREEGVTCVSCHKKEQAMHGPFGAKTDAHPSEKDPAFTEQGSTALCASCHSTKIGPVLPVAKDFEEAKLADKGKSCVGCHMAEIERHMAVSMVTGTPTGEKRKGRKHDILGPNDPEFCAKAFKLGARTDGKDIVLTIENEAGHRVPGLTLRKFVVVVRCLDGNKKEIGAAERFEISSDNELKVLEKREYRFAARPKLDQLEVEIEHHFDGKSRGSVKKVAVEIE